MFERDRGAALGSIDALFRGGTLAGLGDGDLLDRFLDRERGTADLAFAALVERHGPMVLRVCRRVLGDRHDAEDAFQATFLALARGAGSIRRRDSLAPWLHGAALRVAAGARSAGARRRRHEARSAALRVVAADDRPGDDLGAALHEEVGRLPTRYRAAVLLCDVEGLSLVEAAHRLACPVGTVKSRLARGRVRLRDRLARRGLAPAALAAATAREATAAVAPALVAATTRAASRIAEGRGVAGLLAATVESLVRSETRRMLMRGLWTMTATLATAGLLATGATLLGQQGPGDGGAAPPAARPDGTYQKTYDVGDLVGVGPATGDAATKLDMAPLVDLITSTVAPGRWRVSNSDGRTIEGDADDRTLGSIVPFSLRPALIVRQTPEVHAQVAERLEQLRRIMAAQGANQKASATQLDAAAPTAPVAVPVAVTSAPVVPASAAPAGGSPYMMEMMRRQMEQQMVQMAQPPAPVAPKPGTAPSLVPPAAMQPAGASLPQAKETDLRSRSRETARPEAETQRRLRAVEEKLDRVLKALDATRGEAPKPGDALRR